MRAWRCAASEAVGTGYTLIEPEHLPLGVRLEPSFRPDEGNGELTTLEEVERRYIKRVLDECKGHRQKAAKILGISERNLYRKLKEFQAEQPV